MSIDTSKIGLRSTAFTHSRTQSYSSNNSHNISAPSSSRHLKEWQFGWWDYAPIFENHKRPIQWTSTSLIMTAHATEPLVVCLHFPSNKHFFLPTAPSFQASHLLYEPPSIIVASARTEWVFAFFPGINRDGVGCLWKRGHLLDDWKVKDLRTFVRGNSVVTARWLDPEREWIASDTGMPQRMPMLGPYIPLMDPVLFIVTEMQACRVFYHHSPGDQIKTFSVSLRRRTSNDSDRTAGERADGAEGLGRCLHAAIGFGYDESSILIATYSSFVPSRPVEKPSNLEEINISLGMPDVGALVSEKSEWETWRDENMLEICEANLTYVANQLQLSINPLPPIYGLCPSTSTLTNLTFVPFLPASPGGLPSTPTLTHRFVTPQSSPASAPAHIQSPGRLATRPPIKTSPSKPAVDKAKARQPNVLCLLCTTLDLAHQASGPTSEVTCYVFSRAHAEQAQWQIRHTSHYAVPKGVVTHVSSCQPLVAPQNTGVLLGILSTEGQPSRRKDGQYLAAGKLQILRLLLHRPDLVIDATWEATDIVCPLGRSGAELPFSMAVSPNRNAVCSVSQPGPGANIASASIYSHPVKNAGRETKQSSTLLQLSFQRRNTPSDIIRDLSRRETPMLEDIIGIALLDLESPMSGSACTSINDILGAAVEIYRTKSAGTKSETENALLISRYHVAIEICSLTACNALWEDMSEGESYTPDSIWGFLGFCAYYTDLLVNLIRDILGFFDSEFAVEATVAMDIGETTASSRYPIDSENDTSVSAEELTRQGGLSTSMTHIVHPYSFENLHRFLKHMRRFRENLGFKAKGDEQYLLMLEILVDIVESSGLDLTLLDKVFGEISSEVNDNAERAPDLARCCLASLQPPIQYVPLVRNIAEKIIKSGAVQRSRLFVVPDEFVDGMLGLSIPEAEKCHPRDIISKASLEVLNGYAVCARCGSSSAVVRDLAHSVTGRSSERWSAWERTWQSHCVCGGLWYSGS